MAAHDATRHTRARQVTCAWRPRLTLSPTLTSAQVFGSLGPANGLASGMAVRPVLERSNLPVDVLRHVWNLSDIDRDGCLDQDEFAVAMHLARESTSGRQLPSVLPRELIPPSKR